MVGTLITGAARLLLAITERLAEDSDLTWAFCDTDSMALANYQKLDDLVFSQRVRAIREWFSVLSPYDDERPLLKLEHELKDSPSLALYCLAISAKRYVLFNIDTDGKPVIRRASAHGMGQYMPPYGNDHIISSSGITPEQIKETGLLRWHLDVWYGIITNALAGNMLYFSPVEGEQFAIPATCRYAATSPHVLRWVAPFNKSKKGKKASHEQIKPFGFIQIYQSDQQDEMFVLPGKAKTSGLKPHIMSPFNKDLKKAALQCFDCTTGIPVKDSSLKTLQHLLADYHLRPEAKFLNGRPYDIGMTQRRHGMLSAVHNIGKEANRLDEQTYLGDDPDEQSEYGLGSVQRQHFLDDICKAEVKFGAKRLALAINVSQHHVRDICKGKSQPSDEMLSRLFMIIKTIEISAVAEIEYEQGLLSQARTMTEAKTITIREMAQKIGVDASNLAKLLLGKRHASETLIKKLDNFFQ